LIKIEIRRNTYYDSVTLMIISKEVKKVPGVSDALIGMGTDLNREIAQKLGLACDGFDTISANDFFIAAHCDSEEAFHNAVEETDRLLSKKAEGTESRQIYPTLNSAMRAHPDLNMAVISVPGAYASEVAQDCLNRGINVMLFSDNVTVEEELELKTYAASKGLLVMGPDCGTAIINQTPLAFANVIRKGNIGLVCASGTGAQEVSSIISQLGGGISQLIGTGGRDLSLAIGGIMMQMGLDALIQDQDTEIIVLVSKPPAREIAEQILNQAAGAGKPVVVCFIGGNPEEITRRGLHAACSLEDAAHKAVDLANGRAPKDFTSFTMGIQCATELAAKEANRLTAGQLYLRGLYTGGTLCDESMKILIESLGCIHSNIPLRQEDLLVDARSSPSVAHTFLDFGDDAFTVGRPHPMIDPSLRAERLVEEAKDRQVAVILVDCVIGYGSHPDPAHDLSAAIMQAKLSAEQEGRYLCVVASVCGTEMDPQNYTETQKKLETAGAIVMPSNAQAARFANLVLTQERGRQYE